MVVKPTALARGANLSRYEYRSFAHLSNSRSIYLFEWMELGTGALLSVKGSLRPQIVHTFRHHQPPIDLRVVISTGFRLPKVVR